MAGAAGAAEAGAAEPVLPSVPATGPGRAGRDLRAAIAVGLTLAAAAVVVLFTVPAAFLVLLVVAVALGTHEVVHGLRRRGLAPPVAPLVAGAVVMLLASWFAGAPGLVAATAATLVTAVAWRGLTGGAAPEPGAAPARIRDVLGALGADVVAVVAVVAYLPLAAAAAVFLLRGGDGGARVFTLLAVVVANDVGGYAAGVLAGRHPMAPAVSPRKTWEGFAGSLLACVAVGIGCLVGFFGAPAWQGVAVGAALALTATAGDLAESWLKRRLGIKDMGSVLPGHGGVMERLDSMLPSAPALLALLTGLLAR